MSNAPDPHANPWPSNRQQLHAGCFACDPQSSAGLGFNCLLQTDGSVIGIFTPAPWMRGYHHRMHGGLVATLLDSAMTQCLMAHGIPAVTAILQVRYRAPVSLEHPITITARIHRQDYRIYDMRSRMAIQDKCVATADAKFMPIPESNEPRS